MGNPSLVLASNSPRRRELLALGGWSFSTHPAEVDESQLPGEAARAYVLRLAISKAAPAPLTTRQEAIILAADTTVVDGKTILGKPANQAEAADMLQVLRNRSHQVYTGIAIIQDKRWEPGDGPVRHTSTDARLRR